MRAGAQIHKLSLLVKADLLSLRKVLDKLHLIWFIFFFKISDGFIPGLGKAGDGKGFLDNFFHFLLDLLQILCSQRRVAVHVIVESIRNGRSDSQLYLGIQSLNSLGHNMGSGVPESSGSLRILKSEDAKGTVLIQNRPKIHHLSIHFPGSGHPCQALADICRNVYDSHRLTVLFL